MLVFINTDVMQSQVSSKVGVIFIKSLTCLTATAV